MSRVISLRNFVIAGDFGGLQSGTHPSAAISLLGDPTNRYKEDNGVTYLLYGWYEIAFFDDRPMYVQNDHMSGHLSDRRFQNDRIEIEPWIFGRPQPLTKTEILECLAEIGADCRRVMCNGREVLQTGCGVILDFEATPETDGHDVCFAVSLNFPDFPVRVCDISE